jgi:hypothetical protein
METLVAVLLYIGAISTNIEYTEADIYQIESQNQITVDQVESDPLQIDQANDIWNTAILIETGDKAIVVEGIDW